MITQKFDNDDDSWTKHVLDNLATKPIIKSNNGKLDLIVYDPGDMHEKKYISYERLRKFVIEEGYGQ